MRDARVSFDWADGTYSFRLAWGQLEELQEKCDAGPYVVLQRLHSGAWRIEDITNIIRLGLIGGGMEPAPSLKLARRYVEERPPMENLIPAQVILSAGLTGAPEEKVGEDAAASQTKNSSTNSQTES
ncbi:gene transfer agent family protein [Rhizobium rhizogenes]|nr:gene transfer agent family protein [Rhizobium rhizogenes]